MAKYLIDTHTFLWFVSDAKELSPTVKNIIENVDNQVFISIASLWEISIKMSIGKLNVFDKYETVINDVIDNDIEILPITFIHTVKQNLLPLIHRDPFDRIILAQALVENIDFLSCDEIFDKYLEETTIKRIW